MVIYVPLTFTTYKLNGHTGKYTTHRTSQTGVSHIFQKINFMARRIGILEHPTFIQGLGMALFIIVVIYVQTMLVCTDRHKRRNSNASNLFTCLTLCRMCHWCQQPFFHYITRSRRVFLKFKIRLVTILSNVSLSSEKHKKIIIVFVTISFILNKRKYVVLNLHSKFWYAHC